MWWGVLLREGLEYVCGSIAKRGVGAGLGEVLLKDGMGIGCGESIATRRVVSWVVGGMGIAVRRAWTRCEGSIAKGRAGTIGVWEEGE